MPAATIVLSTRIGAPAASALRPAATAPRDQARSPRIVLSPAACARRTASGCSGRGKRARSASRGSAQTSAARSRPDREGRGRSCTAALTRLAALGTLSRIAGRGVRGREAHDASPSPAPREKGDPARRAGRVEGKAPAAPGSGAALPRSRRGSRPPRFRRDRRCSGVKAGSPANSAASSRRGRSRQKSGQRRAPGPHPWARPAAGDTAHSEG